MVTYPEDWTPMQLKDLGCIQMCRRIFQSQTKVYGAIPFYKISTFGGKADAYISQELYEQYKVLYPYPEKGDVLISAAGTIGKTVIFDGSDSYFQDSNIVWLKVDKNAIDRNFLWWFYRSYPWEALEGTTIQRLYNSIILKTEIHLPDKPEQEEIARTLSQFDTYIDDLAELIEKKRGIRDGVLEDLMSGATRFDGFFEEWQEKKLRELCTLITKQTGFDYSNEIKDSLTNYRTADSLPFIQNKDFEKFKINYKTDFYIPSKVALKYAPIVLDEVCLLISISGRIGNVAVFSNEETSFAGGAVGVAKLIDPSIAEWCMLYLSSSLGQKQIFRNEKVGAQHNLTVEDVRNLVIKLPNKEERESIVYAIKTMDEEIEALEIERDKMIQIREGAMDDLLTGRVRLKGTVV